MRGSRLTVAVIALVIAAATTASAADSGTISGTVFDQNGEPAAGATVRLSSDRIPGPRSILTGANGFYQFQYLIPGEYTLEVDKPGVGMARRLAVVEVGKDTQVDLVIGLALAESVTVTAVRPVVDIRSTEVAFNFTADTLNSLPIERTFRGLFQLVPGVADNRSRVGPAAGGSRQDNTYLVDGANITNPGFGYLSTEVNEFDIAEVNLKRAGISAEFGRTAGTVVNAVSRSGSNRLALIGRFDWLPESFVSGYTLPNDLVRAGVRPGTFRDSLLTTHTGPAFGVGGPIVRDRVFFYGSARYVHETRWDRVNKVSTSLPDEVRTGPEFYAKVTAGPTPSHLLTTSYRHRPNHVENAGLSSEFAPSVATTTDNGSGIGTIEWASFLPGGRSLNARYLYMKEKNEDTPVRDLGYLPPFNPANLTAMGQFTDASQSNLTVGANQYSNIQNYRRHETRATFTQFMELGRSSHILKAGGGYELGEEVLSRTANGWGAIVSITQSGVPALRTRYYTQQAPQVGAGRTWSMFVQDDVAIGGRLSLNLGLLMNRDEFSQTVPGSGGCPSTVTLKGGAAVYESKGDSCRFLRFGFSDEIQPRLGASYQLREGKGDKAYANWGRYFNMDQKSSGRSLAPSRIFQTQTIFDLTGAVLSTGPLASTTGKMIDPAIKPIYSDELLLGYSTPVGADYGLDVFVLSRKMHNFIEDVPSRQNGTAPDSGPFVAANLPCVRFAACQNAHARRTYRAVTIDLRRRLARGWASDISYTWSRFAGNFDLDYSPVTTPTAVFNTSSFIQDGPGTNVEDPNRDGPLFEDRPHVFKIFASYEVTSRVNVSGYFRVQSGTPWAARGRDWEGAVLNYLEPAGSHRNPTWTNLDLMGSYRLPSRGRLNASLEARLLNVFDNQTKLSTDAQQFLDLRTVPTSPYFAPYLQANPFFGTGNTFAPPRRLHVALTVDF
ncbi:MAG: carboxypeptidase regulatory-like domain-containing protein [Vicinamibacterales bacterium]